MRKSVKMALNDDISAIAGLVLQTINGFVVDVNMRGERGSTVVEVFADTDEGITADQCALVSRHLAIELDKQNLIPGRYRLEVSSPGLDRPLKLVRQFRKNIGRKFKVIFPVNNQKTETEGELQSVNETTLTLMTENKQEKSFALNDIEEAYVLPQFKHRGPLG